MADVGNELLSIASQIAEQLDISASQLQKELLDVELKKHAIEAQLHSARLAVKRVVNYRPALGADYQCPSCWVRHEKRAALTPISGDDIYNRLRCECGQVYSIPLR